MSDEGPCSCPEALSLRAQVAQLTLDVANVTTVGEMAGAQLVAVREELAAATRERDEALDFHKLASGQRDRAKAELAAAREALARIESDLKENARKADLDFGKACSRAGSGNVDAMHERRSEADRCLRIARAALTGAVKLEWEGEVERLRELLRRALPLVRGEHLADDIERALTMTRTGGG